VGFGLCVEADDRFCEVSNTSAYSFRGYPRIVAMANLV
jgi:hypothetical protein